MDSCIYLSLALFVWCTEAGPGSLLALQQHLVNSLLRSHTCEGQSGAKGMICELSRPRKGG